MCTYTQILTNAHKPQFGVPHIHSALALGFFKILFLEVTTWELFFQPCFHELISCYLGSVRYSIKIKSVLLT